MPEFSNDLNSTCGSNEPAMQAPIGETVLPDDPLPTPERPLVTGAPSDDENELARSTDAAPEGSAAKPITSAASQVASRRTPGEALANMPLERHLTEIEACWGQSVEVLGPHFYWARLKMRKPGARNDRKSLGKVDEGFKAWLDARDIPRSTAYTWADRYAIKIGAKKEAKPHPKPTSSKSGKGTVITPTGGVPPSTNVDDYPDRYQVRLDTTVGERKRYERAICELSELLAIDGEKEVLLAALFADFTDQDGRSSQRE